MFNKNSKQSPLYDHNMKLPGTTPTNPNSHINCHIPYLGGFPQPPADRKKASAAALFAAAFAAASTAAAAKAAASLLLGST